MAHRTAQEASAVPHAQWLDVYVEEDCKLETWVLDEARQFSGNYRAAGIHHERQFFLKKERGAKPLYIFFTSTPFGFDGGWHLSDTLGGSSLAWAMADEDIPPRKGWLMRGHVPGFHVQTSLRVEMQSTMAHEVACCMSGPGQALSSLGRCLAGLCDTAIRGISSLGYCFAGACIAAVHGNADGVRQLKRRPKCKACMEGMLKDMSCNVPISYAFEHAVDAWYRAYFVDGLCHTASYEKGITSAERAAREAKLKATYGGYTNPIAQEMACHEPFASAVAEWLNVSSTKTAKNMKWARAHPHSAAVIEEMGCHVPFNEAIEDLMDHAQRIKNDWCDHTEETVKPREIKPVESKMLTADAESQERALKAEADAESHEEILKQSLCDKQAHLEAVKQLESEIARFKHSARIQEMKLREIEASYSEKLSQLEVSNAQKAAEIEHLQSHLTAFEQNSYSQTLLTLELSNEHKDSEIEQLLAQITVLEQQVEHKDSEIKQLPAQMTFLEQKVEDKDSKIDQLLAQITVLEQKVYQYEVRESEAQHEKELLAAEPSKGKEVDCMSLDQVAQLEGIYQLKMQGQEGMYEARLQEVEAIWTQKLKEVESTYCNQIRDLTIQACQVDSKNQDMNKQLAHTSEQSELEKTKLRQQYEFELQQAEEARVDLEVIHAEQFKQLQTAVAVGNQRRVELEEARRELEDARRVIRDLKAQQVNQEQQASVMAQQIEDSRKTILELETDTARKEAKNFEMEASHKQLRTRREKEVSDLTDRVAELQGRLMTAPEDTNMIKDQLSTANARVAELQGKLTTAAEDSNVLRDQLSTGNARVAEMQGRLMTATEDSNVLRDQLSTGNVQMAEMKALLITATEDSNLLRDKLSAAHARAAELQSSLMTATEDNFVLREQLSVANAQKNQQLVISTQTLLDELSITRAPTESKPSTPPHPHPQRMRSDPPLEMKLPKSMNDYLSQTVPMPSDRTVSPLDVDSARRIGMQEAYLENVAVVQRDAQFIKQDREMRSWVVNEAVVPQSMPVVPKTTMPVMSPKPPVQERIPNSNSKVLVYNATPLGYDPTIVKRPPSRPMQRPQQHQQNPAENRVLYSNATPLGYVPSVIQRPHSNSQSHGRPHTPGTPTGRFAEPLNSPLRGGRSYVVSPSNERR